MRPEKGPEPFKIQMEETPRGFARGDFRDRFGQACSIQESSLAEEPALWLGVDKDLEGQESSRMHLTQEQVEVLLPLLITFVETGTLRQ